MVYQSEELPSSRLRVRELAPYLAPHGLVVEVLRYPRTMDERRRFLSTRRDADVILLQKKLPSTVDAFAWEHLSVPFVFDFDDAIMMRDRPKHGSYASATRSRRFTRIAKAAAGLVAGNRYLASFVEGEKPVLVLPTPVPHRVPVREHSDSGPRVVGWLGLGRNLGTLLPLAEVLARAQAEHAFVLRVISDRPLELSGVRSEWIPWSKASEDEQLARLDVGIMALSTESPWDKGKCSYKLLKYMAAGLPVIATKVGMNEEVVSERSGFLVEGPEAWLAPLLRLSRDLELRRRMGQTGRAFIERELTFEVAAARLAQFLRAVAR
ncbi:MAG: glycosyltransferase [Deltaproteobacteria bacterium]|nr:glycosyltransferase [Deltaproteobacteria bacterium]